MNPPNYYFMPLHSHFDGGFGAIGDAFEKAGDELARSEDVGKHIHVHLPVTYLYRHAAELYLKSMIVMVHKTFEPSTSPPTSKPPEVLFRGKWRPFDKVHNVGGLWDCLKTLMDKYRSAIEAVSTIDWTELDPCAAWAKEIDASDPIGTLLKYPASGNEAADREKTSFKTMSDDLLTKVASSGGYVKGFVLEKPDGSTESYMLDHSPIKELRGTISQLVKLLSAASFAMRCELGKGL
ncbi:MAG: hypothetical protein QOE77_2304 [Blastocatellia bacterium]|jgi:hypothetical protein|nr:hypothetical protein [Blastocatellia bacterium]